ncbi:MAG: glutamate carboxypeptidase, partial [Flavobacteriaceae bacterium]
MRVFILLSLLVNFSLISQNNIDEKEVEKLFLNLVNPDSFKSHLKELTKKPHVAGSIANEQVQNYIKETMSNAGLKAMLYPYDVYMSKEPGNSL